jgi:hypothetical protein
MTRRTLVLASATMLLAALVVLPIASASGPLPVSTVPICPLVPLPIYDVALCWANVVAGLVGNETEYVRCNIIGGPACAAGFCVNLGVTVWCF